MSDIIQLLPDSVANQIAAGEVIQRPASVIKELVENAVDAGATVIQVLVTDAGRTAIQVIDNGKGMSDTDARLSFERHATSKITNAADLFALHTMGFRGEALASVAAVAQVELKTRPVGEEIGTHITLAASKVTSQEPCSCPEGSNFLVENLFYNVPARRKFLKANSTEMKNIITAFERIVLVYPAVSFHLYSNGSELMSLKAGGLRQRIVDVMGKRINQFLLPVNVETSICKISGFVGKPESARKKNAAQYFFVNGRYMKHPYFNKAVLTAYDRLVPEGEQVPYFIYFEVDPQTIDVNIHPTKTEIKFENEQSIWQILMAAVKESIGIFSNVTTLDFDTQDRPDIPVFAPDDTIEAPKVDFDPGYNPFDNTPSDPFADLQQMPTAGDDGLVESHLFGGDAKPTSASGNASGGFYSSAINADTPLLYNKGVAATRHNASQHEAKTADAQGWEQLYDGMGGEQPNAQGTLFPDDTEGTVPSSLGSTIGADSVVAEKSPMHYQYKGKYIMTAVKSGLMIVDQYRAHVRILYEQYLDRVTRQHAESQKILFPEVLHLTPGDDIVLQKITPELTAMGFDVTSLGGSSYAINAVPAGLDGVQASELVQDMISSAGEQGTTVVDEINRSLALSMARHAAVTYGCVLNNDEMENIVNSLFACSNFNYTPDGKTILCIVKQSEIEHLLA